jgi:hypothetical protein
VTPGQPAMRGWISCRKSPKTNPRLAEWQCGGIGTRCLDEVARCGWLQGREREVASCD